MDGQGPPLKEAHLEGSNTASSSSTLVPPEVDRPLDKRKRRHKETEKLRRNRIQNAVNRLAILVDCHVDDERAKVLEQSATLLEHYHKLTKAAQQTQKAADQPSSSFSTSALMPHLQEGTSPAVSSEMTSAEVNLMHDGNSASEQQPEQQPAATGLPQSILSQLPRLSDSITTSRSHLSSAFLPNDVGLFVCHGMKIVDSNAAFCELFQTNIVNKTILDLIDIQDQAYTGPAMLDLLLGTRQTLSLIQRFLRPNGECFWGQYSTCLVESLADKSPVIFGMLRQVHPPAAFLPVILS